MHSRIERGIVRYTLILLTVFFLSGIANAQLQESPWPKFHKDLKNTGVSPYVVNTTGTVKWSYPTGAQSNGVVINSEGSIIASSEDAYLYILEWWGESNITSGVEGGITGVPAVDTEGIIYFGNFHNIFSPGKFKAYFPNGTLKWSYTIGSTNTDVDSSPSIDSNGYIYFTGTDGIVYSLFQNGTARWTRNVGIAMDDAVAIDEDRNALYFTTNNGSIFAVYLNNGSWIWGSTPASVNIPAPAVGTDGIIYFGSDINKLFAYFPNGTQFWSYTVSDEICCTPAVGTDGLIYFGSADNYFYSLYPDGTLKWNYDVGRDVTTSPAIDANGDVYVGTQWGNFYSFYPNGSLKWTVLVESIASLSGHPAIDAYGNIYTAGSNGKIYKLGTQYNPSITSWLNTITNDAQLNISVPNNTWATFSAQANQTILKWKWRINGTAQTNNSNSITVLSSSIFPNLPDVQDDFSDGNYTSNPVWEIGSGTWDASNFYLTKTNAGDWSYIGTPSTGYFGVWNWSMKLGTTGSDGNVDFKIIATDTVSNPPGTDGGIDIYLCWCDLIYVTYYKGGASIFQDSIAITSDTNWHNFSFSKNESHGMELLMDGISIWSRVETANPITKSSYMTAQAYDVGSAYDNISYTLPDSMKTADVSVEGANENDNTTVITWNIQFGEISEITTSCPIGWCYLGMNYTNKTLLELDNLFSTDITQGWYNSTSQKYENHRTGYSFNQNVNVSQKWGYYYYFSSAQNVTMTPGTTPSITLKTGWSLTSNYGTTARTLAELKSSIGATATSAKYYDKNLKAWVSSDSQSVPAMEAFFVYNTNDVVWSG